jgi:hypothetical protein
LSPDFCLNSHIIMQMLYLFRITYSRERERDREGKRRKAGKIHEYHMNFNSYLYNLKGKNEVKLAESVRKTTKSRAV